MLQQNFSAHNDLKHPGQPASTVGDTKITGFFRKNLTSKKQKMSACEEMDIDTEVLVTDSENEVGVNNDIFYSVSLPSSSVNDTKLDEILERVKDIQISVSATKTLRTILPPLAKPYDVEVCDERIKQLTLCRSIDEIIDIFNEFQYQKEKNCVICTLCVSESVETCNRSDNGTFLYNAELGLTFDNNVNLPRTFINLKKNLKDHLNNKTHTDKWTL